MIGLDLGNLFRSELDRAEWVRLQALGAANPFLAATTLVPMTWKPAGLRA